jgi:omega-amidase
MINVSLVQSNLFWEDKESNLEHLEQKIAKLPSEAHIVVLPEMFSTGFSMRTKDLAEPMDGATIDWMRRMAMNHRKIITGSLIIHEADQYFNRLVWMMPNGQYYHYDKRHLFGYAGESQHYTPGSKRIIVQVNGWKICLQICYDLRFPVWARNTADTRYDMLIYVASWPERRNLAWKTLLQARAIENQCYVVAVNRIGNDGNDIYHSGDSSVIDPLGNVLWQQAHEEVEYTHTFHKENLMQMRNQFPFLDDADRFVIV